MTEGKGKLSVAIKAAIVAALVVVVAIVLYAKNSNKGNKTAETTSESAIAFPIEQAQQSTESTTATQNSATANASQSSLPKLVDLGADKCVPCKMMAPILEEMKTELSGQLDVQFIDVWKNEKAGEQYGISVIPTQIFYDAAGKELFRHEGFFGKEDMLAKWKEFGFVFDTKTTDTLPVK